MTAKEIISYRLIYQQIADTSWTKPEEIVSWLGAVQAQDWLMATWALGLRLPGSHYSDIEDSLHQGKILRTHVLRPTWHFVTPGDIRWMLQLTAPRVHALNALYYRKYELDKSTLKKCHTILVKQLQDHQFKTRDELNMVFAKSKIIADRLRLSYIMMHAELEQLICSGPRKGKQFTYALIEERAPKALNLSRDEAMKELATRYFTSRGPATIKDYAWWSGLTMKEAKEGIMMLDKSFITETVDGTQYFFQPRELSPIKTAKSTFLVPDYDEYGIGYKDRTVYNHPTHHKTNTLKHADYFHAIAVDGYFAGNWKKNQKGSRLIVEYEPFPSLPKTKIQAIEKARQRYLDFFSS